MSAIHCHTILWSVPYAFTPQMNRLSTLGSRPSLFWFNHTERDRCEIPLRRPGLDWEQLLLSTCKNLRDTACDNGLCKLPWNMCWHLHLARTNIELPISNSSRSLNSTRDGTLQVFVYESVHTVWEYVCVNLPEPGAGHVQSSEPVAQVWLHWAAWWLAWTPNDTGSWSLQTRWHWKALCIVCRCVGTAVCLQMLAAVVLTPISPLPQTHLYRNIKSSLAMAFGTLILFFYYSLPLVSTPLQAEKHLSSKSLQTTTVLNLIKDIADNRRAIKQQSLHRSTRAYIPVAQRVTPLCFTSQRFFKVISWLCVPPLPPPSPVNQVMLVGWNNTIKWNVFYYWLWIMRAQVGCKWMSGLIGSTRLLSSYFVGFLLNNFSVLCKLK